MNKNHYNHNSRQKEICFSNQNSCLSTYFGTTKAKAHYRTTKSRGQKNQIQIFFLWLRQLYKISRFRSMHSNSFVKNCEEDKNYHTNYEGNCALSFSLQTRLPSYVLITQFSPQLERHSTSLVFSSHLNSLKKK